MIQEQVDGYTEKQQRIFLEAEKLFATKGFEGTSVRDIAQEAGVNLAMISYYFGSKEKLLEAIFDNRLKYFQGQLHSVLNDKVQSPLKKVYYLIDILTDRLTDRPCFHRIMVREQINDHKNLDFIKNLIIESKRKNQQLIGQIINEGQQKGVFKKNIDISLMMMTMFGTMNQMVSTQHYYKEINGYQDMAEPEFQALIKKKLRVHLKTLFKAILSNEN